jgi:hypothetical protein
MENKKQYNTIEEGQLEVMVLETIKKLETSGNENDTDQLAQDVEDLFFDLYDEEYELWGMSARESEDFVSLVSQISNYYVEEMFG